jgi:hypothetical protein
MKKILWLLVIVLMAGCATHKKKKPKCNTCPKWDDRIEQPQF